jgi:diaminopimelate decarboxylase
MSAIDEVAAEVPLGLYPSPGERFWQAASTVPTPALIYDFDALAHTARVIQVDIGIIPDARLNLALKACHTPAVLAWIASLGLGCDVASVGELRLALNAGFDEISATGPAFSVDDFRAFHDAGVVPDVDSISQLETYAGHFPGGDVGLRVRLPLAAHLESNATFGAESRFGIVPADKRLVRAIVESGLRVTRLHVHTGQMLPEAAVYKLEYLLAVAEVFREVDRIDLGGGLFHFYADPARARAALASMRDILGQFNRSRSRSIDLRFEPGGALMAPCGYLIVEVRALEEHPHFGERIATVDASAWNVAPWHKPQVFVLPEREGELRPGLIAGNTLYENDFFGRDVLGRQEELRFGECRIGDRLVITAAGAYTMTNGRRFNRIPMPSEFAMRGEELVSLAHVDGAP